MTLDRINDSVPIRTFSFIIGVIAIVGNGIILYIVLRFKKFRSSLCNCLMGLLAFCSFYEGISLILTSTYAFYRELSNITTYSRIFCLGFAMPGIFGVISSQLTMLWMAVDRYLAIRKPLIYYQNNSKVRLYISTFISISLGISYSLFAAFSKETKPTDECSIGASVSKIFIGAYAVFSVFMAVSMFAVYITTVILLIKRLQIHDSSITLAIQRQRSVFISISLILLSYAIFWCIPVILGLVVVATSSSQILLGYISLLIGICSGLNSCVGIFIYLAKHQELKEYFVKIFPIHRIFPKEEVQMVVPMASAIHSRNNSRDIRRVRTSGF